MKLILCPACQDVFKLGSLSKSCECGKCWGYYKGDWYRAVISTHAIPLGFNNPSLGRALGKRTLRGEGRRFEAFVIPKQCSTIEVHATDPRADLPCKTYSR